MGVIEHRCHRSSEGRCAKGRSLFVVGDGSRVCVDHLTPEERSCRHACSHSLAPSGTCSFCGKPGVPEAP